MRGDSRGSQWLMPMLLLAAVALALVTALFSVDHYLDDAGFGNPLMHYVSFDAESVSNSIGVLSSIVAAVLGIIMTVVSIVVQLAATRFTPAVTEMFFRDRTNRAVMALYIVGCVMGFWTAFGVNDGWVPRVSLIVMLGTATLGFVLMAPYFAYVFRFLAPENVVSRIKTEGQAAALAGSGKRDPRATAECQRQSLGRAEQLTDIAINAVVQKDKIIATHCVDALKELTLSYLEHRPAGGSAWYRVGPTIANNPDFASMASDSVAGLDQEETWFEFKILRQYQSIYTEALGTMRDLDYVVAINTRAIAEKTLETDAPRALGLAIKFFNTYLRATLNQGDIRTAYTILNQYRIMAESVMRAGRGDTALKIANHIKYYGHLSYRKKLAFVTETVAYDLSAMCEYAHELSSDIEEPLLDNFLEVDPTTTEGEVQEESLRGVRKAQIKLATYYLKRGDTGLARRVWSDMTQESAERLRSIRDELLAVETKDFWEISDRGGNFDYLDPDRKAMLTTFFGWFADVSGELKTVSMQPPSGAARDKTTGVR